MFYVINVKKGYTEAEKDTKVKAQRHCRNASELFGTGPYLIVEGAKRRNQLMKNPSLATDEEKF